jgi:hypothetical protein
MVFDPDYLKTVVFDPLGKYSCAAGSGGMINSSPTGTGSVKARQIYCRITEISLLVGYVNPVGAGYVPKSISLKYNPMQFARELITSATINTTFTVPASTRSIILCLTNRFRHVCADAEEVSLGGAGITSFGKVADAAGVTHTDVKDGSFVFFNKGYNLSFTDAGSTAPKIEGSVDYAKITNADKYQVYPWQSAQISLGNEIQPREMYSNLSPATGQMSRPWMDYTNFISKFQGLKASNMSYAQYCGFESFFREDGVGAGDVSSFLPFVIRNPSGTLATTLSVRGQLTNQPDALANQELVCIAISDQLWSVGFDQSGSELPVMTETNPLI